MSDELKVEQLREYTAGELDVDAVHRVLLWVEQQLGRRPSQVLGPKLRVRWPLGEEKLIQLQFHPVLTGSKPHWRVDVTACNRREVLGEEHLAIKYATDIEYYPYLELPYMWNLRVCPPGYWDQDYITPVPSWRTLCTEVGEMVGYLPLDLAALPAQWFDGEIQITDKYYTVLDVIASRTGLRARVERCHGEGRDEVSLKISPLVAPQAGYLLLQSYAANFSSGFPLQDTQLRNWTSPEVSMSGFITNSYLPHRNEFVDDDDFYEFYANEDYQSKVRELKQEPEYTSRISELIKLADWHDGPHRVESW